jgi:hypothetical protein
MSAASLTFSQVGYVNKSFWRNPARTFFTSTSSAYAWGFTISGIQIGFDLVLFETGTYTGYLAYSDLEPPARATVSTAYAR